MKTLFKIIGGIAASLIGASVVESIINKSKTQRSTCSYSSSLDDTYSESYSDEYSDYSDPYDNYDLNEFISKYEEFLDKYDDLKKAIWDADTPLAGSNVKYTDVFDNYYIDSINRYMDELKEAIEEYDDGDTSEIESKWNQIKNDLYWIINNNEIDSIRTEVKSLLDNLPDDDYYFRNQLEEIINCLDNVEELVNDLDNLKYKITID